MLSHGSVWKGAPHTDVAPARFGVHRSALSLACGALTFERDVILRGRCGTPNDSDPSCGRSLPLTNWCKHGWLKAYCFFLTLFCACHGALFFIHRPWTVQWNVLRLHRHRPQIEKVGTDGSQRGNQRLPWQGTAGSQTLKLTVPNLGTRGYHCKELPVPRS